METPKIWVASLSDYNEGRLIGKWVDLSDYGSGEEVLEDINDYFKDLDEETPLAFGAKREEYGVFDFEGFPKAYYSEYMGAGTISDIIDWWEFAKDYDVKAVEGFVDYGHSLENFEDAFFGIFEDREDFAYEWVEMFGGYVPESTLRYNYYISDLDKRLLAQDMTDSYIGDLQPEELFDYLGWDFDDIPKYETRDRIAGNTIDEFSTLEEANKAIEEYEKEDKKEGTYEDDFYEVVSLQKGRIEEEIDKAREEAREEYYNDIYHEIDSDAYYYFVEDQGIYSPEDFFRASFVQVDYESLADELLINDYFDVPATDGIAVFYRNY